MAPALAGAIVASGALVGQTRRVNPMSPEVDALVRRLEQRHGAPVELVEPESTPAGGADSTIAFVQFSGAALPDAWRSPLVVRTKGSPDRAAEAEREAHIHRWLTDRDFPVPEILEIFAPGDLVEVPVQVMTRAPGSVMAEVLRRSPWRTGSTTRSLADLQARLHDLDPAGLPPGPDLLDRRLGLTRRVVGSNGDPHLARALERVDELAPLLREGPASLCHGDLHPFNVVVGPAGPVVVDWTDAALGDPHGDVARTVVLFEVVALLASGRGERVAMRGVGPSLARRHRRAYGRRRRLDVRRIDLWRPVHLLHDWARTSAVDGEVADQLAGRFASAMADVS